MLPEITAEVTDENGMAVDSVSEGDMVYLTLTAVRPDDADPPVTDEDVMVALSPSMMDGAADTSDYEFMSDHRIEIPGGSKDTMSEMVSLVIEMDSDVHPERLILDAEVAGDSMYGRDTISSMGIVDLPIMDTTSLSIQPKAAMAIQMAVDEARMEAAGADMHWTNSPWKKSANSGRSGRSEWL